MSTSLLETPSVNNNHTKQAPMQYQITIIQTQAEFEAVAQEWDAFLEANQLENLCMTYGWLSLWLKYFTPEELCILIVKDAQQQWVAIAPLMISQGKRGIGERLLRQCQFIGTNPTVFDWMDIPTREDADVPQIISLIAQILQSRRWDVLDLQFWRDQKKCELLNQALNLCSAEEAIQIGSYIPYVELPENEEAYEKVRRKKTRLEVNRHCNRFIKEFEQPPLLEFQPATEATNAILTRFFNAHIKYWAEKGHKSDFQRFPNLQQFYKDMLAYSETMTTESQPKLLFSVLTVSDYQLSYHLGFWQGHCYLSHLTNYNQGFKGYSPGTIHMDKLIFETIARGGSVFEFGRGDEPYKQLWTKEKKPIWNLFIYRTPQARALWQFDLWLKKLLRKST